VRLLGLASGSYYVLHMALLSYPFTVAVLLVPAAWSASYPAFVGIGVLVLSLAFLAPIAVAGYHLVEAPGIALGRQILRWRRRQVAS
jgi:hypothetical protein